MKTMLDGNLRILDERPSWAAIFEDVIGDYEIVAVTAFGLHFCVTEAGKCAVFYPETLELELLEIGWDEALKTILDHPHLVQQDLYGEAMRVVGKPEPEQQFGFKVDPILGGERVVRNIEIVGAATNMRNVR